MNEAHLRALRCPQCGKNLFLNGEGEVVEGQLTCKKGHTWEISNGIPTLVYPPISEDDAKWIAEYDEMAESYDEMVLQYNEFLGIDMMKERTGIAQHPLDIMLSAPSHMAVLRPLVHQRIGK